MLAEPEAPTIPAASAGPSAVAVRRWPKPGPGLMAALFLSDSLARALLAPVIPLEALRHTVRYEPVVDDPVKKPLTRVASLTVCVCVCVRGEGVARRGKQRMWVGGGGRGDRYILEKRKFATNLTRVARAAAIPCFRARFSNSSERSLIGKFVQ